VLCGSADRDGQAAFAFHAARPAAGTCRRAGSGSVPGSRRRQKAIPPVRCFSRRSRRPACLCEAAAIRPRLRPPFF